MLDCIIDCHSAWSHNQCHINLQQTQGAEINTIVLRLPYSHRAQGPQPVFNHEQGSLLACWVGLILPTNDEILHPLYIVLTFPRFEMIVLSSFR